MPTSIQKWNISARNVIRHFHSEVPIGSTDEHTSDREYTSALQREYKWPQDLHRHTNSPKLNFWLQYM